MANQDRAAHRPRKRFGQNFLRDPGVIASILRAISPKQSDRMVEIGPGQGAITGPLLGALDHLSAIEIDRDLAADLRSRFTGPGRLDIHVADALKFDFGSLAEAGRPLRVVGNLPYNISTPLLFHLLKQSAHIQDMHFLLQKEVVERIVAPPGSRDYGRLSVMVQARCEAIQLFDVGSESFWPAPKVESAFVRLIPAPYTSWEDIHGRNFANIVLNAFSQRRKTLRNSLRGILAPGTFETVGIDPGSRPETLDVNQFRALAEVILGKPQ